ncbi:WXG100 family type VII secretion target [Nonomuraea rubra]
MSFPDAGQLLRQAAEMELLATSLTRYAKSLEEVFTGTLADPGAVDAFWKGPAAGRFNTQAAELAREIESLREGCASTAERLRRQAGLLRQEAGHMA